MIEALFFYMFSAVMLGAGLMVVVSRNPVFSVLFLILAFCVYRLKWLQRRGAIVAAFLISYGLFRLSLENVRNPDIGMPAFPLGLTMGMMLSALLTGTTFRTDPKNLIQPLVG